MVLRYCIMERVNAYITSNKLLAHAFLFTHLNANVFEKSIHQYQYILSTRLHTMSQYFQNV